MMKIAIVTIAEGNEMTPRNFQPAPPPLVAWRKYIFCFVLVSMFVALVVGGPMRVHSVSAEAQREAKLRHRYQTPLFAHRGDIVDANGQAMAMSADVYDVRADMVELTRSEKDTEQLNLLLPQIAELLQVDEEVLRDKLAGKGRATLLRKSLPPSRAEALRTFARKHRLHGLRIDYNSKRYYPQKESAASLVGYTNHQDLGRAGIEMAFHGQLRSVDGESSGLRALSGVQLNNVFFQPPQDGDDITLHIDSRLQYAAYRELRNAMQRYRARAAAAAVMDAQSGAILALASAPAFNPNNIQRGAYDKNHAISDAVEPGSLVKPFIAALALQNTVVNLTEKFPTTKPLVLDGVRITNAKITTSLNLEGVLKKSSNIGAALLAHRLGHEKVGKMYERLGFGGGRILGMPGETGGSLRSSEQWSASGLITHGYGYGMSASLIQLLATYSVFGDGQLVQPQLIKTDIPPRHRRVFSQSVAQTIRGLLESVTKQGGTGKAAAIAGYRVAGKTGTAIKQKNGSYQRGLHRAFFIGLAPASQPRYIVAVMIDEPQGIYKTGGTVAAPVFREIMRRTLLFNAVPPDESVRDV